MRLDALSEGRENNLNLIRLCAASAVLLTHSFALVYGNPNTEPLRAVLGMSLGDIAVDIFFILSGYLVCGSLLAKRNIFGFISARAFRIYPGLWAVVLISTLVIGPWLTTNTLSSYFSNIDTWKYLFRTATAVAGVLHTLPGVLEQNPYPAAVNGSLWTLPYELRMYIGLLAPWILSRVIINQQDRLFKMLSVAILTTAAIAIAVAIFNQTEEGHLFHFTFHFFSGVAFSQFRSSVSIKPKITAALLGLMALSSMISPQAFHLIYTLTIGYIVLCLGYIPSRIGKAYSKAWDISYGVYIYAFPIQQVLIAKFPLITVYKLAASSMALTIAAGMISWLCIESPAMKWRATTPNKG